MTVHPGTESFEIPGPDPLDEIFAIDQEPCCRICGCTDGDPCLTDRGPCFWIAPDLCSRCAAIAAEDESDPDT